MIILYSVALTIFSLYSVLAQKKLYSLYFVLLMLLALFSCVRYAVGTDYFSYAYIYSYMPLDITDAINAQLHGEIGFKVIIVLLKNAGFTYQQFLALVSMVQLFILHKIIKEFSPLPLFSLVIFYNIYYHVYVTSGIRSGLVMVFYFYGITYYLPQKKYGKFIIVTLLASTIHFTALLGLAIIPADNIIQKLKKSSNKNLTTLSIVVAIGFIIVVNILNLGDIIVRYFSLDFHYEIGTGINVLPFIAKLTMFAIVTFFYFNDKNEKNRVESLYYISYAVGTFIYFVFATSPMVSRVLAIFTLPEVILIPNIVHRNKSNIEKFLYFLLFIFLTNLFFLKDLGAFSEQQKYYNVGITNHKYFTIFNKDEMTNYKPHHRLEKYLPNKY